MSKLTPRQEAFCREYGFYTYELIDPRCGTVFYVGKGSGKRISDHVLSVKRGSGRSNKAKVDRISEILNSGNEVIERVNSRFSIESDAYEHERQLIKLHGFDNLTNAVDENGRRHRQAAEEEAFPESKNFPNSSEWAKSVIKFFKGKSIRATAPDYVRVHFDEYIKQMRNIAKGSLDAKA